jgi:2-polyprenyl-3-methyl-5-hydroxy-6-metoxy-1,4-benzoquinol methylase
MYPECPVCNSQYTSYVRDVTTIRTRKSVSLYACLDCKSFWNPSGYSETDSVLLSDMKWGLGVEERNRKAAGLLFDHFGKLGIPLNNVVEIGCGIGTMIAVAKSRGATAIGFEVNKYAVQHGHSSGLDIRCELWNRFSLSESADLIICISVLEHIPRPRQLIEELCRAAVQQECALYISVPFLERSRWEYILDQKRPVKL